MKVISFVCGLVTFAVGSYMAITFSVNGIGSLLSAPPTLSGVAFAFAGAGLMSLSFHHHSV
jgi:hypothetical protein